MSTDITRSFDFHGDQIDVIPRAGTVLVSIRRICEALCVDYSSQLSKLKSSPWATVVLSPTVGLDGRTRELATVDLKTLPMWLATISVSRVAEEARPKLERYQRECADVLAAHFLSPPEPERGGALLDLRSCSRDQVVGLLAQALEMHEESRTRALAAEATIVEQAPRVDFADRVLATGDTYGFREAVKVLKPSTGATEAEVRTILFSNGIVQRLGGKPLPTYTGEQRGYVTSRLRDWVDDTGVTHSKPELRITPKGVEWLLRKLRETA